MSVSGSNVVTEMRSIVADVVVAGQRNPRILFLIRSFGCGGAQRQLVALATALRRAGWDVSAACFYAGDAFQHELEQAGVGTYEVKHRSASRKTTASNATKANRGSPLGCGLSR